jgi:hypothetical protein
MLNLLIPQESHRLPTVEKFRATYTQEDGTITAEGEAFFQSHVKGLISYLNREFDPTAFAPPKFHHVKIAASGADLKSDNEIINICLNENRLEEDELDCDIYAIKDELEDALDELKEYDFPKKELAERKRTLKANFKKRIDDCKKHLKSRKNAESDAISELKECIAREAKTRKTEWKFSQQKTVKKCLGKSAYGDLPKFTRIGVLNKMGKHAFYDASAQKSTLNQSPGPLNTPVRSLSPNRMRYMKLKKTRKTRKTHSRSSSSSRTSTRRRR